MDEIYLNNVKLRQERLEEAAAKAKVTLEAVKEGITEEEFTAVYISLKNKLENFRTDLATYMEKCRNPDTELIQSMYVDQIKAEDITTELETIRLHVENKDGKEHRQRAKLPKLELGKFNGDILEWTSFWERFKLNVHDRDIDESEKLSYLLGALEGIAYETIDGLGPTKLNYPIAIDLLMKSFGDPQKVIDAHNKALHNLKCANMSNCRKTLNSIEKHLRILESWGEKVDSSSIRVIILDKFPENVIYQVHLLTVQDCSVAAIRVALNTVISALERSPSQSELPQRDQETSINKPGCSTEVLHVFNQNKKQDKIRKRKFVKLPQRDKGTFKKPKKEYEPKVKRQKFDCIFCKEGHWSENCTKYQSYMDRVKKLQKRCFICFKEGHRARTCTLKRRCVHCQKMHNRALCPMKTKSEDVLLDKSIKRVTVATLTNKPSNFLQTAVVKIKKEKNNSLPCRLLLDSGSQRSYITARLAKQLHVIPDKEDNLIVYTFGCDKPKEISSPSVEITIITKRGVERKVRVNIVTHITDRIPVACIDNIKTIDILADDNSSGASVDLLIGNDIYFSFMRTEHFKIQENLYCIDTDFGWILSGSMVENDIDNALSVMTYCQCHEATCPYFTEPDLPLRSIDVSFLWTLESIGIIDSPKTTREEEAVRNFNETTRYVKGRYEVKWPWIQFPPDLPSNFGLAFGRLKGLIKRSDKATLEEYNRILEEQLAANIIEIVDPRSDTCQDYHPIHYLPHHMVKQTGKRGRIVYDASAKVKDQKSLNECLYRGPSMLEDLTGLLLKFRQGSIGITADVEKAFLQVGLQNEDRDVTRFLWVKNINEEPVDDNLVHFRFCRVPFGIISSPFLLTATIRYHMARTDKSLIHKIANKCYVDNLVTTANSIDEAKIVRDETTKVFNDLSMNIRDWTSNSKEFLEKIPQEKRAKDCDTEKVLGLLWDLHDDTLQLKFDVESLQGDPSRQNITKRDVLSALARLYDPCGFVSPVILPAKLLFQELCSRKLKWEETLPEELQESWINTLTGLISAKDIRIPRYFGLNGKCEYELHGFADASKNAYAAVAYLRIQYKDVVKIAFLMSKSRVTPVDDKSELKIPRLELLAYLIGARLLKYIKSQLEINFSKICLWSDSQIVLAWLKSNKLLPPFVLRRVNEIKNIKDSLGLDLCYVNTKANPADVATRPELWEQKQDLWFNGPNFLTNKEEHWPKFQPISSEEEVIYFAGEDLDIGSPEDEIGKGNEDQMKEPEVLDKSLEKLKTLQKEHFPEELEGKETHLSRNLGLYLDVDGILRSKGRLSNTEWTYDMKHPILIPKDSAFTNDLILKVHKENYHVGVSHTLSILRKQYWIPHGRIQVHKVLRKCPECVKHGGGPYNLPPAPALPAERVNYSSPFTFTGIDYLGPILVKANNITEKRWICLLTCLAVRAIHLELVKDLTAEECLLALRRFVAVRCAPQLIVSDNALQFKLTSEVLTSSFCVERNIKWKFITQLAPWQGGFYERLVALVKHCMKRTLDKHLLSENQLKTVVKEIEAVINTRPLTSVGSELEEVLRPADFLTLGKCIELNPTFEDSMIQGTSTKVDLIRGWKRGHMILAEYKDMFMNQYLPSLRERYNRAYKQPRVKSHRNPEVGDIVQIKDDSKTRINWKIGKISTLVKGKDGECRVAKIKVGNSEFTRSIAHLYPLEVESNGGDMQTETSTPAEPPIHAVESELPNSAQEEVGLNKDVQQSIHGLEDAPMPEASAEEHNTKLVDVPEQSVPTELVPTEEVSIADAPSISHLSPGEMEVVDDIKKTAEISERVDETVKRHAAIRAREKIAEWTRQLLTLL